MKKSKIIKLVLVTGILSACSAPKDPNAALYERLNVRTDTDGVYTTGEPYYNLDPYGDEVDSSNGAQADYNSSGGYNPMYYHFWYHHIGYTGLMLAPHSNIEVAHISRGGFGHSAFHVSS